MLQTPSYRDQLQIERTARLARFSAAAVPDRPMRILSALQRAEEAPDRPMRVLPAPISNDEAHALVWPWIPPEGGSPPITAKIPKIDLIQNIVASSYEISRTDMVSARRLRVLVRPRQIAMYLSKLLTLHSLPLIGHHFGRRDHTTVLHAIRKLEVLAITDMAFAAEIESLRVRIMGAVT